MSLSRRMLLALGAGLLCRPASAQNVIEAEGLDRTAPPVRLAEAEVLGLLALPQEARAPVPNPAVRRVTGRLERHVRELVEGFPWQPLQITLGISGYETYFNHPEHLYHAAALALPFLSRDTAAGLRRLLTEQLAVRSPYAVEGYENRGGRAREPYDIPPGLRTAGRGRATSLFGVYAFWEWCRASAGRAAPKTHWEAVRARVQPLLSGEYPFDPACRTYTNDEAQKLNGDLAGLLGAVRLARLVRDEPFAKQALGAAARLLELRVNLDRINPGVLEKTNSTTKHLHAAKLARYVDLVPEVGEALRTRTDGLAAARLKAFRESRSGWHLAFGERLIGGENYISPPHLSRALFAGAALVERLPAGQLLSWVDVPWGRADLFFIEKCALALRRTSQP